jgi:hypothetical protein
MGAVIDGPTLPLAKAACVQTPSARLNQSGTSQVRVLRLRLAIHSGIGQQISRRQRQEIKVMKRSGFIDPGRRALALGKSLNDHKDRRLWLREIRECRTRNRLLSDCAVPTEGDYWNFHSPYRADDLNPRNAVRSALERKGVKFHQDDIGPSHLGLEYIG